MSENLSYIKNEMMEFFFFLLHRRHKAWEKGSEWERDVGGMEP